MLTLNDMQFVPLSDVVYKEQPNDNVVTYPPSPSYVKLNAQAISVPYQNPAVPVYPYQNGQIIPGSHIYSTINGPIVVNTMNVYDCLIWSVINILCYLCLVGFIATRISVLTKHRKTKGDLQGARCASKWAAGINILANLGDIISHRTEQIDLGL